MRLKPAVAVPLAVVLLAAAALIWNYQRTRAHPQIEPRPVRCEACGYLFIPRSVDEMDACPKCSSTDLVSVCWFTCRQCGTTFIGYEADPKSKRFRFPGGEWTAPEAFVPVVVCPACESKAVSSTTDVAKIRSAIDAMQ